MTPAEKVVKSRIPCRECGLPLDKSLPNAAKYHIGCKSSALLKAREKFRMSSVKCGKCKVIKSSSSFSDDSSRTNGKFPWCKTCQNDYATEKKFQNSEDKENGHDCPLCDTPIRGHKNRRFCSSYCKNRVAALRKKFNLSVIDYRRLVDATGGLCPLCENRVHTWHVDHNHKTGEVTGVVCAGCNVGPLAMTYHDIEFVRRLMDYLNKTPASKLGIQVKISSEYNQTSNLHKVWKTKSKALLVT